MRKTTLIALAVGLAALSPFAYLPEPVLQETPRFAVLLAVGAAFLALWAVRALAAPDATWRSVALPAAAVAIAAGVSSAFAFSPALALTFGAERSMLPLPAWLAMLAVFVVAARVPLGKAPHAALAAGAVVAAAMSTWAAVQGAAPGGSAEAVFGNADYMGAVVLLFLPIAAVGVWRAKTTGARAGWVAAVALLAAAVMVGGVITVLVAAAGEALLLLALTPALARWKRPFAYAGAGAFALGAAGVALGVLAASFPRPFAFASAISSQPTFASRYELWRAGWLSFASHPLLGAGPDGMPLASQAAITAKLMRLESAAGYAADVLVRDPHALPLLVLGELGVAGAAVLVWLAAAWVRALRTRVCGDPRVAPVRLAYASGVAGFLFAMLLIPWTVRFAAMPALLAGLAIAPAPAREKGGAKREAALPAWAPAVLAAAVAVALVPGALALAGDRAIDAAKSATSAAEAESAYSRAVAMQPTRPYPRFELLYLAGYRLREGAATVAGYRQTVDAAPKEVRECAPYLALLVEPSLDQAQLTARRDLAWEAERLRTAARLAPDDPDVVLERGHLALLGGRLDEAGTLLERVRSWGSPKPRLALYEALLKKARNEPGADAAVSAAVTKAPYLSALAAWPPR